MKRIIFLGAILLCAGLGACSKPTALQPPQPQALPPVTINIYVNGEKPAVQYQLPGQPAQMIPPGHPAGIPAQRGNAMPPGSNPPAGPPMPPIPQIPSNIVPTAPNPGMPPTSPYSELPARIRRVSPAATDAMLMEATPNISPPASQDIEYMVLPVLEATPNIFPPASLPAPSRRNQIRDF